MNQLIQKAENILDQCEVCSVSSITENGFPRICVLKQIKTEGIKKIWFSTATSSKKIMQYLKNPKAGVCFYLGGDSVSLIGNMRVVQEKSEKDALWLDWLKNHFKEGKNDPEYCVIAFISEEATLYIDDEFETMKI